MKLHTYRPDFLINDDTIIEVKPAGLVNNITVQLKKEACEKQFNKYNYKFMTENDMMLDYHTLYSDVYNGMCIIDKGKQDRYNRIIKNEINK